MQARSRDGRKWYGAPVLAGLSDMAVTSGFDRAEAVLAAGDKKGTKTRFSGR